MGGLWGGLWWFLALSSLEWESFPYERERESELLFKKSEVDLYTVDLEDCS